MTTESTSADDADRRDGSRLSEGLGLAPEREAYERAYNAGFVEASRMHGAEIERLRAALAAERERCAKLPRLPTPRVLASGTIAGKAIELRGWHTDDIEIWERQHGLKFGA